MRKSWVIAMVFRAAVVAMPLTAALTVAQAPKVLNTEWHTEPAGSGLSATVGRFHSSAGVQWIGYEVATRPRRRVAACSGGENADAKASSDDGCCGVYRLEEPNNTWVTKQDQQTEVMHVNVLARLEQGEVTRVIFINRGCQIDGGGVPFTWITDVKEEDSVAWLSGLVKERQRPTEDALATIAMHQTERATAALVQFSSASNSLWLREKASFWLGAERGHEGLLALEKMTTDADPEFRKKVVFDLSVNHEPEAIDEMIRMAKTDENAGVRETGIFWVGQKAGVKAVATLKDTLKNDPELGVKKKAVFALSQLPKDEAVPELMHVAETNTSPELRKEAIFWLGQTHDPRALAYFEKILER